MKKIFSLVVLACLPIIFFAQNTTSLEDLVKKNKDLGARFEMIAPFSPLKDVADLPGLPDVSGQFLLLDETILKKTAKDRPATMSLILPKLTGEIIVDLVKYDCLSEDFWVSTTDSHGQPVAYEKGAYYRGTVRGERGSLAAVSFFEDEIMGMLSIPGVGNLNLGRIDQPGNTLNYILFADDKLPKPAGMLECHAEDRTVIGESDPAINQRALINGCIRVYLEADYGLFQDKITVAATVNWMTGLYNIVATLYSVEDISTVVSNIHVWTTDDGYPFGSSGDALDAFRTTRTSFDGDLAHLFALDPGGLGGVAYLNVLCSGTYCYAYSDLNPTYNSLPTYSWSVMVVTHEMGHNVGSNHTQNCNWTDGALDNCYTTEGGCPPGPAPTNGGTIMSYCHLTSYGINLSNGFGTFSSTTNPRQTIQAKTTLAANNGCIVNTVCTTAANLCGSPTNFTMVGSPGNSSAVFSWTPHVDNTSSDLRYRVYGTSTWTTITGVTSPYTLTGLAAVTKYEVEVRGVCSGGPSDYFVGIYFKTILNCVEPNSLTTTSITSNSAILNWTEASGGTSWQVKYGTPGFDPNTAGTLVAVASKPYTLTGLTVGTAYEWYVRTNCNPSGASDYAGPGEFTTRPANDDAGNATLLSLGAITAGTNGGSTTQNSEPNPLAPTGRWFTTINNTVWYKFVAPTSGSVTITTDFSPQGTNNDSQLALYQVTTVGNFSTYTLLVSDEDNGTIGNGYSSVFSYSGLTSGTTYYIQVDGYGSVAGTFNIQVTESLNLVSTSTVCSQYPATTLETVDGATYPNRWWNIQSTPFDAAIGNVVVAIKTTQNLGTVTAKIANNGPGTFNGTISYLGRYLDLQATNPPTAPVDVRLFFKNTEFAALQTYLNQFNFTIQNLTAYHYDGANEDCLFSNNGGGLTSITSVTRTQVGATEFFLEFTVNSFSELMGVINTAALPLELAHFSAKKSGTANLIEWSTAAEKNVAKHRIERSPNGATDWSEIATVDGQKDAPKGLDYRILDEKPLPISYYRLRSVDFDGVENWSPVASVVRSEAGENAGLQVFPVPTRESITVQFNQKDDGEAQFLLFDLLGRAVFSQKLEAVEGLNNFEIQLSELESGSYFGILENELGRSQVVRVVKN